MMLSILFYQLKLESYRTTEAKITGVVVVVVIVVLLTCPTTANEGVNRPGDIACGRPKGGPSWSEKETKCKKSKITFATLLMSHDYVAVDVVNGDG